MRKEKQTTQQGHVLELIDLLDTGVNKFYGSTQERATQALLEGGLNGVRGEFALVALSKAATKAVTILAARTIGVPARFACQLVSNTHTRVFFAHTIREIREAWRQDLPLETVGIKPFDPSYTTMLPAFSKVTVKPWAMRDHVYEWFLDGPEYAPYPIEELLPSSIDVVGETYIFTLFDVVNDQIGLIADDEPINLLLSGGADSTAVAFVLMEVLRAHGRRNKVIAYTLSVDSGGEDAVSGERIANLIIGRYGHDSFCFVPCVIASSAIDTSALKERVARLLEEYHPRDVECGMAGLLLSDLIRQHVTTGGTKSRYEFNGDGGNEIFRDYPLEDVYGIISIEDVWKEPFLFLLGYERKKLAYNFVFSGGLGRAYTRTFNPARENGVTCFSPFVDRRVVDIGQRIPMRELAPTPQALYALRAAAVCAGLQKAFGITVPIFPKARFQEGCSENPTLLRVSEEDSLGLKERVLRTY